MNSDSIPKLWGSMFNSPDFTKLFLTRSSAQPRILFAIEEKGLWSIFSLPQHQIPYEKKKKSSSSLVVSAEFHMKFPPENMRIYPPSDQKYGCRYAYASGLIYFDAMVVKEEYYNRFPVICNPKTGRYTTLPYLKRYRKAYSFFGFDPIDKQFKVLFMAYPSGPDRHKILTLVTGDMKWRTIKCSLRHDIASQGICINGVLYYLGDTSEEMTDFVIVCFDVRSEKFSFIYTESFCRLINYKSKLGVIYYEDEGDDVIELRVCVLEDFEKQEWSKYGYTLRDYKFLVHEVSVVGVTATGENILSMASYTSKQQFFVFYFNHERNTLQRVEIQGFGDYHEASENPSRVHVFVDDCSRFYYTLADQVEDLLKSSIYAPYVKTEEESDYEYSDEDEEEDKEDLNVNEPELLIYAPSLKSKPSLHFITRRPKYIRYDDGMGREKKHRERNERDSMEYEDIRRRRHHEKMRGREKRVESGRDRDKDRRYDDGMSREKNHREGNERDSIEDEDRRRIIRCREEMRDKKKRVESGRDRERDMRYDDGMSREKKHREGNGRDSREDEDRRRRRRRRRRKMRDREKRVESGRDRDKDRRYDDGMSREKKHRE